MIISTTLDLEAGCFRLMVSDGRLAPGPAGARLFRAPPHPAIQFEHGTAAAAETDAQKLRDYLELLPELKSRGKKRARSYQEGD